MKAEYPHVGCPASTLKRMDIVVSFSQHYELPSKAGGIYFILYTHKVVSQFSCNLLSQFVLGF